MFHNEDYGSAEPKFETILQPGVIAAAEAARIYRKPIDKVQRRIRIGCSSVNAARMSLFDQVIGNFEKQLP